LAEPRHFPALELAGVLAEDDEGTGRWLAAVDDCNPTAVDGVPGCLRIFFSSPDDRDRAVAHLRSVEPALNVHSVLVSDEAWAERSQASLQPVRIGRIVVAPPWAEPVLSSADPDAREPIIVSIQPSMGFGTGHHASTRLCVHLLQRQALEERSVLDVGTGSGVLAITAARLGAERVIAVDSDPDAIAAARENVERNGVGGQVLLETADIATRAGEGDLFDLLLGNLTGGMLIRTAPALVPLVKTSGLLIVSGFEEHERTEVIGAFTGAGAPVVEEATEAGWVAALLRRA
jgi:ribosomal protein L11 methyltransferase